MTTLAVESHFCWYKKNGGWCRHGCEQGQALLAFNTGVGQEILDLSIQDGSVVDGCVLLACWREEDQNQGSLS